MKKFLILGLLLFSISCGKSPFVPYTKDYFSSGDLVRYKDGKIGILTTLQSTEYNYYDGKYYRVYNIRFFNKHSVFSNGTKIEGYVLDSDYKYSINTLEIEKLDIFDYIKLP